MGVIVLCLYYSVTKHICDVEKERQEDLSCQCYCREYRSCFHGNVNWLMPKCCVITHLFHIEYDNVHFQHEATDFGYNVFLQELSLSLKKAKNLLRTSVDDCLYKKAKV